MSVRDVLEAPTGPCRRPIMPFFSVALPPAAARRVLVGHPTLAFDELAGTQGLEPARPLRLLSPEQEVVGTGIADPENECVRVVAREELHALDARFFRARLAAALSLRRRLGLVEPEAAFRLLHGDGEGLPGLAVDLYGSFALVTALSRGLQMVGRSLAEALLAELPAAGLPLRGVVVRARLKSKGKTPEKAKDEVIGEAPPEKLVVHEHGIPCEVHLLAGTNTGLFLDMREHRRGFARFVRGARVLNTFCYTGTLSVAAALAGAAHVTSVDLAAGTLAWARTNFRLAGLDPEDARFAFVESDVFRYLEQQARGPQRFDVIVLDPPTVSGARASSWSQKNDYPELIRSACALLPREGGHLWVSSNTHAGPGVRRYLQQAFERLPRAASILEEGSLPPDFPTPLAAPETRYLDVCQVRVGPES